MKSLFFRLLLSFWLIMVLTGAMGLMVAAALHHFTIESLQSDMARRLDDHFGGLITLSGQAARQMYRCGGQREYENYLQELAAGTGIMISLIRRDNLTITGSQVPAGFIELAEEVRKSGDAALKKENGTLTVARYLPEANDDSIIVIGIYTFNPSPDMIPPGKAGPPPGPGAMPPPPPGGLGGGRPGFFFPAAPWLPFRDIGDWLRVLIMLLVGSGVCYLLARSLTTPIRKLRSTTQRIAGGDYSARVGVRAGRAGDEIADLGRDFDIMAGQTEKVINSQKRLLRDISHELRSPLARLNVALELVRNRYNAAEDRELNKIGQESERLNTLIEQLLTLARLENNAGEISGETVDLAALIRQVAADVDFEAAGNNRRVKIVSLPEALVTGSEELLRRAIENVLRNAACYTAEHTSVEVTLAADEKDIEITVLDHGPGVPENDLPNLFEPFYRVAEARERQSGGTGLGLAIALQAVKAHGGRIHARNRQDGRGLAVTITLPRK